MLQTAGLQTVLGDCNLCEVREQHVRSRGRMAASGMFQLEVVIMPFVNFLYMGSVQNP